MTPENWGKNNFLEQSGTMQLIPCTGRQKLVLPNIQLVGLAFAYSHETLVSNSALVDKGGNSPRDFNQSNLVIYCPSFKGKCLICCSHSDDFRYRHKCLVDRLLSQGYIALRLKKSFKKFYGRYQDLIEKYQRLVNVMVNDSCPG